MSLRQGHELDSTLAGANLFGWILPAFGIMFRRWPITLGCGVAAVVGEYLVSQLPWPYFELGWVAVLHSVLDGLVYSLIIVMAYWVLAGKESEGTSLGVNPASRVLLVGVQIYVVWALGVLLVIGILIVMGMLFGAILQNLAASAGPIIVMIAFGVLGLPILIFLLSPLWAIVSVAGTLSTAHAVRTDDNGFGAVVASLRLSFDQKWRVFWPSYVIGLLVIGLFVLSIFVRIDDNLFDGTYSRYLAVALTIVSCALGVAMTLVIERAYAPDFGLSWEDDASAAAAPPSPAGLDPSTAASSFAQGAQAPAAGLASASVANAPAAGAGTASASFAAPAAATPSQIAAQLDKDLRSNQTRRLVELTEQGLAADPRFFLIYPESTITLAKKLGQLERADLGVKVLGPFLKDHRAHRLHLTGALLAAGLLGKDRKRLPEAARFLERVKALYPNEPMVDQLIKSTAKAMAAAGA